MKRTLRKTENGYGIHQDVPPTALGKFMSTISTKRYEPRTRCRRPRPALTAYLGPITVQSVVLILAVGGVSCDVVMCTWYVRICAVRMYLFRGLPG